MIISSSEKNKNKEPVSQLECEKAGDKPNKDNPATAPVRRLVKYLYAPAAAKCHTAQNAVKFADKLSYRMRKP